MTSGIGTARPSSIVFDGFEPLTARLDRAAAGARGMTFYSPRGGVELVAPYVRLREVARTTGGRLLARGLRPGDRVAILAETGAGFVETLMGCLYAGLAPCPAPLPPAFGARETYLDQLRALVASAGARAVVAPGMFGDWIEEAFAGSEMVFAGPLATLDNAPDPLPERAPEAHELAYLQFSSGTTRAPKGVVISHGAMMANIRGMAGALGVGEDDRGVSWLPWYHDMGLVGALMLPIACGIETHYLATRDFVVRPGLWPELMSRVGGTLTYAPSFGYELAARRVRSAAGLDLSSWRIAGIGGDLVRVTALDTFAETFRPAGFRAEAFLPSYGLAESTLGVTFPVRGRGARRERVEAARLHETGEARRVGPDEPGRDLVFCGGPLPGHEIEIRGKTNEALGEGRVGRILARGPSLMNGYFGDPEETAKALTPDGWLETGDLGYLRDGELIVTGRLKDMLIVNGRNVWPQDVEWTVEGAVEGARTGGVAVFGLPVRENAAEDERAVIVIECRSMNEDDRETIRRDARAAARQTHGLEAEIVLCPPRALPRTTSGKLMRSRARSLFLAGELGA